MDSYDCTNNDKGAWKVSNSKSERGDGDSDEGSDRVVPGINMSFYKCPFCSFNFLTDGGRIKHKVGSPQKEALNLSKSKELSITKETNFPTFNVTFTPSRQFTSPGWSFGATKDHASSNQGGDDGKQLARIVESEFKMDYSEIEEAGFRIFSNNKALNPPIPTEVPAKPHQCQICLKSFSRRGNLKTHIRTHNNERPHQCQICLKSFSRRGNLKTHIRTHNNERPHQCKFCSKSFGRLDHLKTHILTHTGERPHRCQLCSKSFGQVGTLNKHIRTHKDDRPHKSQ